MSTDVHGTVGDQLCLARFGHLRASASDTPMLQEIARVSKSSVMVDESMGLEVMDHELFLLFKSLCLHYS